MFLIIFYQIGVTCTEGEKCNTKKLHDLQAVLGKENHTYQIPRASGQSLAMPAQVRSGDTGLSNRKWSCINERKSHKKEKTPIDDIFPLQLKDGVSKYLWLKNTCFFCLLSCLLYYIIHYIICCYYLFINIPMLLVNYQSYQFVSDTMHVGDV